MRKIALQERRAKRAEANGKSNETTTNLSWEISSNGHQRQWRKTNTPTASREDMQAMWQHLLLGVRSLELHGHINITQTHFSPCSLYIEIRQGLSELELGDLEAVASPRGSPQLGGYPAIFSVFRFLYRVSTGDYSEIFGPGWHLSSPGQT